MRNRAADLFIPMEGTKDDTQREDLKKEMEKKRKGRRGRREKRTNEGD